MGVAKRKPRLGTRLIERLTDVRDAVKSGQPLEKVFTVRTVVLDLEPHEYDAEKIRETRLSLGVSQALFAQVLGASVETVESWEQGVREPTPMARRLLDEIRRNKGHWLNIIRKSASMMPA